MTSNDIKAIYQDILEHPLDDWRRNILADAINDDPWQLDKSLANFISHSLTPGNAYAQWKEKENWLVGNETISIDRWKGIAGVVLPISMDKYIDHIAPYVAKVIPLVEVRIMGKTPLRWSQSTFGIHSFSWACTVDPSVISPSLTQPPTECILPSQIFDLIREDTTTPIIYIISSNPQKQFLDFSNLSQAQIALSLACVNLARKYAGFNLISYSDYIKR